MIDYELYCRIKDLRDKDRLTIVQIARELHLNDRTVGRWLAADKFRQRATPPRPSKLDAFKGQVVRWLQSHPYTAAQVSCLMVSVNRSRFLLRRMHSCMVLSSSPSRSGA